MSLPVPHPTQSEQDFEEVPPPTPLKRSHATMHAGKAPLLHDEDYESDEEYPNLSLYLAQFDLTPREQMRICRAYASYLGSQLPKRQK